VIESVKSELLSEREMVKKVDIKLNQFRVIKADLIEQQIVREVKNGTVKKYEYVFGAPSLDTQQFEELRMAKSADLQDMVNYMDIRTSRMKYLCDILGDVTDRDFANCDNTGLEKLTILLTPEWNQNF
jgi:ATP-dependent DNA helicase RecQ